MVTADRLKRPRAPGLLPKSDSYFDRETNPQREGLEPLIEEASKKPISFRPYLADAEKLNAMKDRSGFIRNAVREKLDAEGI